MKTASEYRAIAREKLNGRWTEAAVVVVIYLALTLVSSAFSAGGDALKLGMLSGSLSTCIEMLVIVPLGFALSMLFLGFARNGEEININALLEILKANYSRIVVFAVIYTALVFLGIFTFGILSIYVALCYAMVPYLLRDYPELTWREAMKLSRQMMDGHKLEYLWLQLSYIGWAILAILTLGIGLIFLTPWCSTSYALYYEDLKAETIVEEDDKVQEAEVVE